MPNNLFAPTDYLASHGVFTPTVINNISTLYKGFTASERCYSPDVPTQTKSSITPFFLSIEPLKKATLVRALSE